MSVRLGYRFAAIPEWVLYHEKLSGDDVRVWGVLARYGNDVRPSLQTIADRIGKSRDTAKRCVARLVEVGAVHVEERWEDGRQLPNRYHLAGDEPIEGGCTSAPGGRGMGAPGGSAPVHHEREQDSESKNNETPQSPPRGARGGDYSPEFDALWEQVGRRGTKLTAWRAWRRLSNRERDEVRSVMPMWVEHWSKPDAVAQPHLSTFLNQRRWEDEPQFLRTNGKKLTADEKVDAMLAGLSREAS